jgi:hypothetical protein
MAEYRAFNVGSDGHLFGFKHLICADDAEAIAQAKLLIDSHFGIELWSGDRLVSRLKAAAKK